jgi:CPA2 family monovalent cation:H+ antiporter-2
MAVRRAVEHALAATADITVLSRTHSEEDRDFLVALGVDEAVVGELELALELGRRALERLGVDPSDVARALASARRGDDPTG